MGSQSDRLFRLSFGFSAHPKSQQHKGYAYHNKVIRCTHDQNPGRQIWHWCDREWSIKLSQIKQWHPWTFCHQFLITVSNKIFLILYSKMIFKFTNIMEYIYIDCKVSMNILKRQTVRRDDRPFPGRKMFPCKGVTTFEKLLLLSS